MTVRKGIFTVFLSRRTFQAASARTLCTKHPSRHVVEAANTFNSRVPTQFEPLHKFSWLNHHAPRFFIPGEQIQVLTEPTQFYEVLRLKTRKAKKRITYASLYLGTGHLEKDLVSCIHEACHSAMISSQPELEVNILLDYTRGSRGKVNSQTMLCPLIREFPNVNVALYHTPDLRGILKRIVPERFNETIGLTHVKIYLFDDSFIISGANLSHDYFTNRQDRYILFNNCPELSDFFQDLVKSIMSFSFQLAPDNTLGLAPDWHIHPFKDSDNSLNFKMAARRKIKSCLKIGETFKDDQGVSDTTGSFSGGSDTGMPTEPKHSKASDTVVFPLVQMGPFGLRHDEEAMLDLLKFSEPSDQILLASGYFNLTNEYMDVILTEAKAKFNILMASPKANGFLGAKGVAGFIPHSYIYLAHQFYNKASNGKQSHRIQLVEYERDGWTFHGKGLWYYLPNQPLPALTFVGSPNFGYRSVYKDLECQVAIVTENKGLKEQLREEHVRMYSSSQPVQAETFQRSDRQVPTWTKLVTNVIKKFF